MAQFLLHSPTLTGKTLQHGLRVITNGRAKVFWQRGSFERAAGCQSRAVRRDETPRLLCADLRVIIPELFVDAAA